jgi:hypothetical protein
MSYRHSRVFAAAAVSLIVGVGSMLLVRPSHSAGGAVPVQITGTASTSDVDNPARQPFAHRFDITMTNGASNGTFTVPAGKRLVITYISSDAGVKPGAKVLLDLATIVNGAEVESHLPAIDQGVILGQEVYSSSDMMDVTADPGTTVTFAALDSDSTASGGLIVGIYGYLITP